MLLWVILRWDMLIINVFSKALLAIKKGVGRIYCQNRGRGRKDFSRDEAPRPPRTFPLLSSPLNPKICSAVPVTVCIRSLRLQVIH